MIPKRDPGYWDRYAKDYSSFQQGNMPERIVETLFQIGYLDSDFSVLEVGSGPGTYSLALSPRVRILTCMDSSDSMLDILFSRAREKGYGNIERFHQDWGAYTPKKGYAACIATLCPGTETPESLQRMEDAARESCAIVHWVRNGGDDLRTEIWKGLGYEGWADRSRFDSAVEWLERNGRDPEIRIFKERVAAEIPVDEVIEKECSALRASGIEGGEDIVRRIVLAHSVDGVYAYDSENSLRLICWRPVSE